MTEPSVPRRRARLSRLAPIVPAAVLFAITMLVARSFAPTGSPGQPGSSPGSGGPGGPATSNGPPPGAYAGPALAGVFVNCSPACDLVAASPGMGLRLTFTDRAVDESAPTLSPDGASVAFRCGAPGVEPGGTESPRPPGPGSICTMSTKPPEQEGATPLPVTTLLSDPAVDYGAPAWSPDGATIAFVGRGADGIGRLGMLDVATGTARDVTMDPIDVSNPAWSPDGAQLAFGCGLEAMPDGGDAARFCVMPSEGGVVTALGAVGGDCGAPTFTPDAIHLGVVCVVPGAAGGDLFFLALSEPMSHSITGSQLIAPEGKKSVVFSPDGAYAYVRREDALWALEPLTEAWSVPPLPPLHGDFDARVRE
jgi:hypothetical protein